MKYNAVYARRPVVQILLATCLGQFLSFASIIPPDRQIPWDPGVPGGIPNRTVIFANVKDAPYGAKGDGVTNDKAAIQSALNACPSNQVVYMPAGLYIIAGKLSMTRNGVTLRGEGAGKTILKFTSKSGDASILLGDVSVGVNNLSYYNVNSGSSKGSTSVVMASTAGFVVGNLMVIDQSNIEPWVSDVGYEGEADWVSRLSGKRAQGQIVTITAINGNAVSFAPALYANYSSSPQAASFAPAIEMSGVENLTSYGMNVGFLESFQIQAARYCWLKGVEVDYTDGDFVELLDSFRCEVRDSYFHDGFIHHSGQRDTCVFLGDKTSACLVENNIVRRGHVGIMLNWGAAGNVIAYNYVHNNFSTDYIYDVKPSISTHGAHPMFNLIEGNYVAKVTLDSVWGSTSHNTVFRNFLSGHDTSSPPYTGRGIEDTNTVRDLRNQIWAVIQEYKSTSNNIVGNMIGDSWFTNRNTGFPVGIYECRWPTEQGWSTPTCFDYGYGGSTASYDTSLNHGNYTIVRDKVDWNSSISDHNLPNSLYLSGKPSWFGNLVWPPVDPVSGSNNLSALALPAGYRYLRGTNPPAGVVNQAPVAQASAASTNGPAPLVVSFSSAGSFDPEGTMLTYSWTFGDGGTSSAANPSHTYQSSGTYGAQLSVSDGTNTASSAIITIRVTVLGSNEPPVAAASATPTNGAAPLVVSFSSAGSYDPDGATLTYNWTFGDGATSTAANPSHSYAAGAFSATLRVSDGSNTTSSSGLSITVTNPAPAVVLTSPANGASFTAPAVIDLAASVTPNGHTISGVQFYSGTALLGEDSSAPYTISWTNVGTGTYGLTARAIFDAGATVTSPLVTIGVGGLVAAYGFEEGAGVATADASGNSNNGNISSAAWTSAGKYGDALLFNGTSSLVTVNDSPSLDLMTGLTLEAWVYPTALGGWRPVVFKAQGTQGICYVLQGSSGAMDVPSLGLSVAAANLMAPSPLPLNTWSHLAATYDGATMRLYVNGTEVANKAQIGSIATSTAPLTIGGDSIGEMFAGTVDEVRVYNRALSASEVQSDMNSGISVRPLAPTRLRIAGP